MEAQARRGVLWDSPGSKQAPGRVQGGDQALELPSACKEAIKLSGCRLPKRYAALVSSWSLILDI
jgi:hypothetical protein